MAGNTDAGASGDGPHQSGDSNRVEAT
jgi:hypothetical protein